MSLFSSHISQKELIQLSRSLGTSLQAGIDLLRSLEMASRRSSPNTRRVLQDIQEQIKSGSDLTSAIDSHAAFFPELFGDIAQIGEQAGALPESLLALSEHYENNLRLKKEFLSQITLPVVQLVVAILVVAALILLLGMIGQSTGATLDVLGWGLLGPSGALTWLGFWAMGACTLFFGYKLATQTLSGKGVVHQFLMRIPVVGKCLQDFAIARFSWALHLTQNAGMPIDDSLAASLRATSNGAFWAASDRMIREIRDGESLTEAFDHSGLFPVEFIQTVYVAETSGTVPEALQRLSPQFEENARRSLKALAATCGWLIWASVAGFIIFIIFSILFWYLGMLNEGLKMIDGA